MIMAEYMWEIKGNEQKDMNLTDAYRVRFPATDDTKSSPPNAERLSGVCPSCGHCLHCGRSGYNTYPFYPYQPYIWGTYQGTITTT